MAVDSFLRYLGADLVELGTVRTEHEELGQKVWLLDGEKHKFKERYVVLYGEKFATED